MGRCRQGSIAFRPARNWQDHLRNGVGGLLRCDPFRHLIFKVAGEGVSQRFPEGDAEELPGRKKFGTRYPIPR